MPLFLFFNSREIEPWDRLWETSLPSNIQHSHTSSCFFGFSTFIWLLTKPACSPYEFRRSSLCKGDGQCLLPISICRERQRTRSHNTLRPWLLISTGTGASDASAFGSNVLGRARIQPSNILYVHLGSFQDVPFFKDDMKVLQSKNLGASSFLELSNNFPSYCGMDILRRGQT